MKLHIKAATIFSVLLQCIIPVDGNANLVRHRKLLTVDATLENNVETTFPNLPTYDSTDEESTVQVFKVSSGTIDAETTVRCQLSCTKLGSGFEKIRYKQGGVPSNWDDYDQRDNTFKCGNYLDQVMTTTTSLYVSVTTDDSNGFTDPTIHCRLLPSSLTKDGVLDDDVETSFPNLPRYDPLDEDGTIQVYQITSSAIAGGTRVRCGLFCTKLGSGFEKIRYHQGAPPSTWDDYDE